ncbi:MAG: response regulator [bacterium]|nr:response regulator [bacterium]
MGIKILLVDDSAVMRKMITRSLRQANLDTDEILEANNGQEALEVLAAKSVDIILCDWNMPVMDGLEFVTKARESDTTPIVMLTTEGTQDKVTMAMGAGANGYLTKPFTPENLEAAIRQVLFADENAA